MTIISDKYCQESSRMKTQGTNITLAIASNYEQPKDKHNQRHLGPLRRKPESPKRGS